MARNQYTEYDLQLIDGRTGSPIDDDTLICNVLTADDPSEVTLYSDTSGTSLANPNAAGVYLNGIIRFYTANTVTSVDISVLTANGHAFFLEGITPSNHRIVVMPEAIHNTLIIPYQVVGASETVVDTGFDLSANMLVKDVVIHVTTLGTGAALDIGTSTDADGFADGVSAATTGWPATLLEEALVSTSSLIGALLANITGTDVRKLHMRANSTSGANIVYTNTTSSSTAGEGYIYVNYQRVPA